MVGKPGCSSGVTRLVVLSGGVLEPGLEAGLVPAGARGGAGGPLQVSILRMPSPPVPQGGPGRPDAEGSARRPASVARAVTGRPWPPVVRRRTRHGDYRRGTATTAAGTSTPARPWPSPAPTGDPDGRPGRSTGRGRGSGPRVAPGSRATPPSPPRTPGGRRGPSAPG